MSSAKKTKVDLNSQMICKYCLKFDEKSEEMFVLTDDRLLSLSHSFSDIADTPQYRISEFIVHDSNGVFCWFDSNPIEKGCQLFLCGNVQPIVSDSDQNSYSIVAQKIGPLQEWWFAGFDGGPNLIIGVESEMASYVLTDPQTDYSKLFSKSTRNMIITKIIIESLVRKPDSSYQDLVQAVEDSGHGFTEESVITFSTFIIEQIKSYDSSAEEDEILLSETSAFKTLVELSGVHNIHTNSKHATQTENIRPHIRPIARMDSRRLANSDTLTCSTPLVTKFFDSIFKDTIDCQLNCSESSNLLEDKSNERISQTVLTDINNKINWIGQPVYEDKFVRTSYYSGVRINDLTYKLGTFVVFRETDGSLKLGRIMFMFSTADKQKLSHIQYFSFGNETILGETAPNWIVFMTNFCMNIEIENIVKTVDVSLTKQWELNVQNCGQYICSKFYIRKTGRFEDLPKEVFDSDIKCINCLINERNETQKIPKLEEEMTQLSDNSDLIYYKNLIYKNQVYSMGDCALFSSDAFDLNYFNYENNENNLKFTEEYDQTRYPERYRKQFTDYIKGLNNDLHKPLTIGFINKIFKQTLDSNEETKLLINVFYRPENVFNNYSDYRCLDLNVVFWSDHQFVVSVNAVQNVCKVIYSEKSPESDFYLETKLFYFNQCYEYQNKLLTDPNQEVIDKFTIKTIEDNQTKQLNQNKYNILDLFSGCGGLSYGFHKLGLVSKLWAVEKDYSAVQSFKANFKTAHVFQEDVNHFLDLLLKGVKCHPNGLQLPIKGQIDLILGGPPCQGFSGMNRFSSRHYSIFKNSLVVSFLSFVDYFRPKYLIFENVRNFSLFKKSMILKLMLSCLVSMGYQCQFAILQSGSYGLPQTRRRTVIMGAYTGSPLPTFPEITHTFSRRQCQLSVTIDNRKYLALKKSSSVCFRTITVDDAISDLPELSEDYASNIVRHYSHKTVSDLTHYQRILRTNSNDQLFDHFCKELSQLCRLRIKNIPKILASDWRDLPNISLVLTDGTVIRKLEYNYEDSKNGRSKSNNLRGVCICAQGLQCNGNECRQENTLIPWCLVHTANRQYQWSGLYGRLVVNGYFPTTVTNPEPISKQGRVLHPNQDRIISVRESARSQGFPDNFQFFGSVSEKYRQIGNAVPIPLSLALGRQFLLI